MKASLFLLNFAFLWFFISGNMEWCLQNPTTDSQICFYNFFANFLANQNDYFDNSNINKQFRFYCKKNSLKQNLEFVVGSGKQFTKMSSVHSLCSVDGLGIISFENISWHFSSSKFKFFLIKSLTPLCPIILTLLGDFGCPCDFLTFFDYRTKTFVTQTVYYFATNVPHIRG